MLLDGWIAFLSAYSEVASYIGIFIAGGEDDEVYYSLGAIRYKVLLRNLLINDLLN
jgi:hypothetical protein